MSEKRLSDEKLKHYEDILIEEKENSHKLINQMSEIYRKGAKDSSGDLSGYSYHQADQGSDTHEQEKTAYLIDTEQQKVKMLIGALKKIHEKTFGICEICGCFINDERLKIIPSARFCIECQTKEEKRKR